MFCKGAPDNFVYYLETNRSLKLSEWPECIYLFIYFSGMGLTLFIWIKMKDTILNLWTASSEVELVNVCCTVANSSLNPRHFLPNICVSTDKTASGFEGVDLIGLICDVLFSYSMYLLEPNTKFGLVSLFNSFLLRSQVSPVYQCL